MLLAHSIERLYFFDEGCRRRFLSAKRVAVQMRIDVSRQCFHFCNHLVDYFLIESHLDEPTETNPLRKSLDNTSKQIKDYERLIGGSKSTKPLSEEPLLFLRLRRFSLCISFPCQLSRFVVAFTNRAVV